MEPVRSSSVTNAMTWLVFVYLIFFSATMPPIVTICPSRRCGTPVSSSSTKSAAFAVVCLRRNARYSSSGWPLT